MHLVGTTENVLHVLYVFDMFYAVSNFAQASAHASCRTTNYIVAMPAPKGNNWNRDNDRRPAAGQRWNAVTSSWSEVVDNKQDPSWKVKE